MPTLSVPAAPLLDSPTIDVSAAVLTNGDVGRAVRRLRHERRLTIEQLAFAAGVHPTYVSGIERGKRNPSLHVLCGLAEALSVPLSGLARVVEVESLLAERMREARLELGMAA